MPATPARIVFFRPISGSENPLGIAKIRNDSEKNPRENAA